MSAALKEADKDAIRRNPNDVLGIQFNQYKNQVYSSSIIELNVAVIFLSFFLLIKIINFSTQSSE